MMIRIDSEEASPGWGVLKVCASRPTLGLPPHIRFMSLAFWPFIPDVFSGDSVMRRPEIGPLCFMFHLWWRPDFCPTLWSAQGNWRLEEKPSAAEVSEGLSFTLTHSVANR